MLIQYQTLQSWSHRELVSFRGTGKGVYVLRWGEQWFQQDLGNWLNRRAGTVRGKWAGGCIPTSKWFRQRDLLQERSHGKIQKQLFRLNHLNSAKGFADGHFLLRFCCCWEFSTGKEDRIHLRQTHFEDSEQSDVLGRNDKLICFLSTHTSHPTQSKKRWAFFPKMSNFSSERKIKLECMGIVLIFHSLSLKHTLTGCREWGWMLHQSPADQAPVIGCTAPHRASTAALCPSRPLARQPARYFKKASSFLSMLSKESSPK